MTRGSDGITMKSCMVGQERKGDRRTRRWVYASPRIGPACVRALRRGHFGKVSKAPPLDADKPPSGVASHNIHVNATTRLLGGGKIRESEHELSELVDGNMVQSVH